LSERIEKYIQLAEMARAKEQYALAIKYLKLALEIAQKEKNRQAEKRCLNLLKEVTNIIQKKVKPSKKLRYSLEKLSMKPSSPSEVALAKKISLEAKERADLHSIEAVLEGLAEESKDAESILPEEIFEDELVSEYIPPSSGALGGAAPPSPPKMKPEQKPEPQKIPASPPAAPPPVLTPSPKLEKVKLKPKPAQRRAPPTETTPKKPTPKKIKRFGDISAPMEMTIKKEYLVNVGLRVFKADVVGMPVSMTISVPDAGPPILEVLVIGRDFKIDQPRRSLVVPLDRDSDILNFRVIPEKEGIRNLSVEFYQDGTLIGRAILKIIVKKKKEPVNENLSSTSVNVLSQFGATRLDATLRIIRYDQDFFFSLFTPRAKAVVSQHALFGKTTVNMPTVHKLEKAIEDTIFDRSNPQAALERLKELGAQIYSYIPKQIRQTIHSISPNYLMIETGDLLVPWELAFDGDDFLCSKYCLGKRVFDETRDFRPPPSCIGKKILDVIFIGASPQNVPEISIKDELDLFNLYAQTKRINLKKVVEPNATKLNVLEILNQGDLIHFTCHGHFEQSDPLESALLLSDDILTADEIDDMEMTSWPLIFANACSTGAISDKIVGIGGIARAFLEAGALAFLGPLFEIPDDIAIEFAKEFYNNLLYNNENLGTAILNTRRKLREQFGGAFWAIFSLYGDPTLSLCNA